MKLAIIGYGKMGKTIEKIALEKGIDLKYCINNFEELQTSDLSEVDVAIEFSQPTSAFQNIKHCLENGVNVVSGTTGWLDQKPVIEGIAVKNNTAFFYASNFSLGVNIFFKMNEILAKMMDPYPIYDVAMEEIHHAQKLDSPSGTAITLAEQIISKIDRKTNWKENSSNTSEELNIIAKRIENVPGTHTISYNSDVDSIEIKHTAHSRAGFAQGAVLAAQFINGKAGIFNMNDLLKL